MTQRRFIRLLSALSFSLMACQPGSVPVSTQQATPQRKAKDLFEIKVAVLGDNFGGYCPGSADTEYCYNSGGTPTATEMSTPDDTCYAQQNCACVMHTGGCIYDDGSPPDDDNTDDDHEPLDLLVQSANSPTNASPIPSDSSKQRATFSPGDGNDAFDWVDLKVFDQDNRSWSLAITNANGATVFQDSGNGNQTLEWSGQNQNDKAVNDGTYSVTLTGNGQTITRELRIDNKAPKIATIKTQPNTASDRLQVEVKITDPGNSPTGIDASSIRLIADSATAFSQENTSYDAANGIWKTEIVGLAAYEAAKQINPQYAQPFEIEAKDYVWNTFSSRESGEDGPLRLRVDGLLTYFRVNSTLRNRYLWI